MRNLLGYTGAGGNAGPTVNRDGRGPEIEDVHAQKK
tara:strand:+ start:1493 stop:1600 length:108 start_codon:yes stop_codon:yes gene_type:complete